jgi:transcriptional regulator with GAF, ATPase, and Fis domain
MLQLADKGTVFLDEIGNMTQAKLLRVIESQEARPLGGARSLPLDIKLIAATNQDLERLVYERRRTHRTGRTGAVACHPVLY